MLWEHIIYASGFPTPDTNLNNPSDNRYAVISAVHDLIILTILIDGSTRILVSALYPSPVERVCRQHRRVPGYVETSVKNTYQENRIHQNACI